ncbi:hypothetical protein THAOC_18591 [Thalassiosira oceanica]|uniref:Uncharacterized protein n=1 Tax=Thalassiosira oceanica TaxID=159749 RepID=K0SRM6_THAOC|nr:hypothetical protein THAOC_18591 [Thalassiosira oceanica]|eukprot:EJK60987.1 hypothetical protein THAOC_18591 [Thalassiosira oceanica]
MKRHGSGPPGGDGGQGSSPRKGVDSARRRLDSDGRRRSRSRRNSRRTPEALASMEAAADDAPPPRPGISGRVEATTPWHIDKSQHHYSAKRKNVEDFRKYFGEPLALSPDGVDTVEEGGTVEGDSDSEGNDEAIEVLSRPTGHSSPTRSQYEKRLSENEKMGEQAESRKSFPTEHPNGPKIISEVTAGMRKVIKNEDNIKLLEKLDSVFSRLVKCWHSLMSVMKSVERQTQAAIQRFGNDLQELVDVITELADKENEVVPGLDVDIPTFLKSHLLFDHLYAFLLAWETLGGLDEQNIESTHPEFNELIRRFGTTRGARLKALVFQEHLFNRADFQNDVVEAMLSETSTTKRPDTKPREEREDDMEAILQTVNDEDLEMRQLEKAMNQNETLRWTPDGVTEFDTSIKVCDQCCKRLIGFGMANHMQEYHSGTITTDRCFNVEQQMLRERQM